MGRLDAFDDFIQKSQYHVEQKKPIKKNTDVKKVTDELRTDDINIIFKQSKENKYICLIFYNKVNKDGRKEKVYRMVVIPEKRLSKKDRRYIEIIDIKELKRKIFRLDRIVNAKLTDKKFEVNQSAIQFK